LDLSTSVVLATNLILVSLNEFGNHAPQQVHFVGLLGGHRRTQVSELVLSVSLLILNFLHDGGQVVSNVNE